MNIDEVKGCNLPQTVNVTNYRILALIRTVTPNAEKKIVKMIINEAPDGSVRLVSVI